MSRQSGILQSAWRAIEEISKAGVAEFFGCALARDDNAIEFGEEQGLMKIIAKTSAF